MKTRKLAGLGLVFLLFLTITAKTDTFHIDGYVITESDHYAVRNQIVEIKNESGTTFDWFLTNDNGLYSGDFEIDSVTNPVITVELSKTCDNEVTVYSQVIPLNNHYLICNFLVCDFWSCRANFNITQINGNDLIFQFTDISKGDVTTWLWDFGDQQTSTEQNPVHQYQNPNHYLVKLEITTNSCSDVEHKGLFAEFTDCLAAFSHEQVNQGNNLMVHFQDESSGNYDHREWEFGDGGGSNQPSPWYQYNEPGEYDVKLHIWGQGCNHTTYRTIAVEPASTCYALFTCVQNHSSHLEVQFTDASIGQADSWSWSFGDQQTSTVQNPLHIYENPGDYEVTLTIGGPEGSSAFTRFLQIEESSGCFANFEFYQNSIEEPMITFENLTTGQDLEYFWSFGDGTTSNDTSPVHLYPAAGYYEAVLTATGFGCIDSMMKQVEVLEPTPCHAAFSFTSQSPEALEIFFTNESMGMIVSYYWDFDDGSFSNEENPVHTYNQPGEYTVLLKIDALGCLDSIEHIVQIAEPEYCNAAFSIVQDYPQNPNISFVNESEGENFTSHWDFGDGFVSEETDPEHEYLQPGQYSVLLWIETSGNCSDTITHEVEILPPLAISGNVMAGTNLFGYGNIFLYKTDTPEGYLVFDQSPLGAGNFGFSGLTPGNYLLQAIPDFDFPFPVIPKYLPTYSGEKSNWTDAQTINTQNLPENITISLLAYNDFFDGKATISGVVNLLPLASSLPLIIYLTSHTGEIFDFKVTDASGTFSFPEIPYGNYLLYPEKAGKTGQSIAVEVSETKPESQNIVFIETTERIYPDLTLTEEMDKNRITIYPNPSGDYVYFNLKNGNFNDKSGNLIILTTEGKIARKFTNISNTNKLDVSSLAEGIYFLRFVLENEILHSKLVIRR